MATYQQQCSQVGGFSYAKNFILYVVLTDRDGNPNTNKSIVDYNVYCQSNGSGSISSNHQLYFELNGQVIRNDNVYVDVKSPNAYIGIASGSLEIEHNSDGSKGVWFNAYINASSGYGVAASKSDTFWLNNIPRYANFTNHYIETAGLDSITVHWNTDSPCDWLQYSLNDGNWINTAGSPTYTIAGLTPNTRYSIRTRVRRTDSQLWTESGYIYGTTKDIARITSAPNIAHGDNLKVEYSNVSNSKIEIGIWKTDGLTRLTGGYRECSGQSYIFNFTDEELDNFYKLYGNDNKINVRVYIRTAGNTNLLDYKDIVITLKGNQKTVRFFKDEYKRGKIWIKKNKEWKRAVIWTREKTGWKRGI